MNGDDSMGAESSSGDEGMGDFEEDFGEFNADEGSEDLGGEEAPEEGGDSLDDLASDLDSLSREAK